MILLNRQLFHALAEDGDIKKMLQYAIELEHATLPLYLYAYYSLDPSKNGAIADIIHSVAIEEMLHLTLAANVLNAIGGSPSLDSPDFIPKYPGQLPGGVDKGTQYQLSPFTTAQLAAFLDIEEPEDPIIIPTPPAALTADGAADDKPYTIGQFYAKIIQLLQTLPASAFDASGRNQIDSDQMPGSVVVTDLTTAVQALTIIIDQGEGTSTSPSEVDGSDWAHYYRYQQIQKGRMLVAAPGQNPPYSFSGDPIVLDPTGVYNVPVNPNASNYTPDQITANNAFNLTYTTLLQQLHQVFNGQANTLGAAIDTMLDLTPQAQTMMQSGTGPTFEYYVG